MSEIKTENLLFLESLENCKYSLKDCPFKRYRKMEKEKLKKIIKKMSEYEVTRNIIKHLTCESMKYEY